MTLSYSFTHLHLLFLLISLAGCESSRGTPPAEPVEEPPTTIILVRHAEKDFGAHPHLTEEGLARAERLAFMLENEDIAGVFATPTFRAMETALPTAEAKGLKVLQYDSRALKALAKRLVNRYRGKTVLVAGHSNTTPELTNYLTGTNDYPRFSELDYTNLYVVTVPATGPPNVLKLRY